jgi:hypothetical protein
MPRTKTVELGGRAYEIAQLPMRANAEWRAQLAEPITQLLALLEGNADLEIGSVSDLAQIVRLGKRLLLGSMDLLLDALFAYSPELSADRERIEAEAYDDEAIAALASVVALAYPLGLALTALSGLRGTPTSTNSPSANGDGGTRQRSAARPKRT